MFRMYVPTAFNEQRAEVLHDLIRAAPFATLVVPTAQGLEANHIPLLLRLEGGARLVGHVARANPVWKLEPTGEALAVFGGAQGYVSPSAYASKAEHGKVVPTWNYVVVHAHGRLRWIEEDAWLAALLEDLTGAHEAARPEPWQVSDAPADFVARTRQGVVGLELVITRLEGKLKLSQNRSLADREGVVALLERQGDAASLALARAMRTWAL
jgi:transcriptional regulator